MISNDINLKYRESKYFLILILLLDYYSLLSPVTKTDCVALEFASVVCPTYDVALEVLLTARERAFGTGVQTPSSSKEEIKAHFFLRILIHKADNDKKVLGSLSYLHIVDLIGTSSIDDVSLKNLSEEIRIAKREAALQLQTLSKVIFEMETLSKIQKQLTPNVKTPFRPTLPFCAPRRSVLHANDAIDSEENLISYRSTSSYMNSLSYKMKVTSARDSKLTCILAPLLHGNCRTSFLVIIKNGESHYKQSKSTLSTLKGVKDIKSACFRVQGISLLSLGLRHADTVLTSFGHSFGTKAIEGSRSNGIQ